MTGFVIAGVIALVIVVLMLVVYSRFVHARNATLQAWRDVDKQLRARYEILPGLLELVQRFARDRGIVGTVNSCRIDAMAAPRTPSALAARERALDRALGDLLRRHYNALVHRFPALLAARMFAFTSEAPFPREQLSRAM